MPWQSVEEGMGMGLFVAGGMGREVGGVISSLRYEYVVALVNGVVGSDGQKNWATSRIGRKSTSTRRR